MKCEFLFFAALVHPDHGKPVAILFPELVHHIKSEVVILRSDQWIVSAVNSLAAGFLCLASRLCLGIHKIINPSANYQPFIKFIN